MAEEHYEQITLPTAGALPGIPGIHGPGTVIIHSQDGGRRVLTAKEWNAEIKAKSLLGQEEAIKKIEGA